MHRLRPGDRRRRRARLTLLGRNAREGRFDLGADLASNVCEGTRGGGAVPVAVPGERDAAMRDLGLEVEHGDAVVVRVDREQRNERGAEAGPDESLHGPVVVRAKGNVEAHAALDELALGERGAPAVAVADQRQVAEVGEARPRQRPELVAAGTTST